MLYPAAAAVSTGYPGFGEGNASQRVAAPVCAPVLIPPSVPSRALASVCECSGAVCHLATLWSSEGTQVLKKMRPLADLHSR
jgi:hypothetical protein